MQRNTNKQTRVDFRTVLLLDGHADDVTELFDSAQLVVGLVCAQLHDQLQEGALIDFLKADLIHDAQRRVLIVRVGDWLAVHTSDTCVTKVTDLEKNTSGIK